MYVTHCDKNFICFTEFRMEGYNWRGKLNMKRDVWINFGSISGLRQNAAAHGKAYVYVNQNFIFTKQPLLHDELPTIQICINIVWKNIYVVLWKAFFAWTWTKNVIKYWASCRYNVGLTLVGGMRHALKALFKLENETR